MQILELQIKNFGKFSNQTITFHDGVNIFYGENEMGKTTIHAFIRGMLFGIEKMRGRASRNDEFSLREPWENPGYFSGVLRFRSGRKTFRIERSFSRTDKKAVLICETDGEELDIAHGDLQILLEGLNEAAFRNTFFIRQKSSETDEGLAAELQNYMTNCESSGDLDIDVTRAVGKLKDLQKEKQREADRERMRCEEKMEVRLQEVHLKMEYVQQEIHTLSGQYESGERQIFQMKSAEEKAFADNMKKLDTEYTQIRSYKKRKIFTGLLVVCALLLGVLAGPVWMKLIAFLGAISLAVVFWYLTVYEKREDRILEEKKEHIQKEPMPSQKLSWSMERLKEEIHEKQMLYHNLEESLKEIREESIAGKGESEEIRSLDLAISTIQEISEDIYKESARNLNQTASDILNEITQGNYTSIFLDNKMQVRINTPSKLLYLEQVSRGTMDQIYFALRMAAGKMFSQGQDIPIILDDAFAMYDDRRLKNTLRWLYKCKSQVLIFTCHKRERQLMDEILEEEIL